MTKYKYKVCVYAICKNEEKNINRWYDSMKEADEIYVLDTGSTDKSVDILESRGVYVKKVDINPWRFDKARNMSLEMVPDDTDICVCTDLDEIFESGWRTKLENNWKASLTRMRYIYNWKLVDNKPVVSFYYDKIHKRNGFNWIHPVHEILEYNQGCEQFGTTDEIVLNHYPDNTKSRGNYLSLLEMSVKEDAEDDRNMHYLGREYMYYQRWNDCIETLIKHLKLEKATWKDERCASMRFIARSYLNLGRIDEARLWLDKAMIEAPHLRDPFVERAILEYDCSNWLEVIKYLTKAQCIKEHQKTYINEVFSWDYTIDNLLSVSYYYLGLYDISLFYINRALKYDDKNQMLVDNKKIILEKSKE